MQLLNLHEIHFSKPVPFLWQILAEKFQLLADEHDEPMSRNRGERGIDELVVRSLDFIFV